MGEFPGNIQAELSYSSTSYTLQNGTAARAADVPPWAPGQADWKSEMNVQQLLSDLRQQRDQITVAILALERLAGGAAKRRGRPPKALALVAAARKQAPAEKKRVVSEEARRRMAEAQKRRWDAYHNKQGS